MSVCVVTGGAGFIGSHLVDALLAAGHEVRVLDNLSTGSRENLAEAGDRAEFIEGDVTDPRALAAALAGAEFVFHLAPRPSVPRRVADPLAAHQACAAGTLLLLLAARDARVRRVVYAACASAYGNPAKSLSREDDALRPLSPHAVAKLAGEHYCAVFTQLYGLETVRLRYFHVYGPRQSAEGPHAGVVPAFLSALLDGRSPVIHGDGLQSRDFTYVGDVVQANLLAAAVSRVAGKVYNVAFGRRMTVLELLGQANDLLGTDIAPVHAPPRAGDVRHSQADTSLGQAELGFCPCIEARHGLELCLPYYRQRRERLRASVPGPFPVAGPHRLAAGNGSVPLRREA